VARESVQLGIQKQGTTITHIKEKNKLQNIVSITHPNTTNMLNLLRERVSCVGLN